MGHLRARLVEKDDFNQFDYIFAMDKQNLANLKAMRPSGFTGELGLFLSLCQNPDYSNYSEVPDPYYGEGEGFTLVLDLIEDASAELIRLIKGRL
jgi:protein-tyrosine phosphatase